MSAGPQAGAEAVHRLVRRRLVVRRGDDRFVRRGVQAVRLAVSERRSPHGPDPRLRGGDRAGLGQKRMRDRSRHRRTRRAWRLSRRQGPGTGDRGSLLALREAAIRNRGRRNTWLRFASCSPSRHACAAASRPRMNEWRAICISGALHWRRSRAPSGWAAPASTRRCCPTRRRQTPIASLSYFAAVIEEVVAQSNTSDTYWSYVRRKAAALEREWTDRLRSPTGSAGA